MHKELNMRRMFGEKLCGARWGWLLLLAIWVLEACSVHARTLGTITSLSLGDGILRSYKLSASPHHMHVRQAARLKDGGLISDTTKPTNVKTSTAVNYIESNNLTEQFQSPSVNDEAEEGLKGGLPFWVIPAIIGGTMVTLILLACMAVSCSVTRLFPRKSPDRSLRDYNKYTFHLQDCEDK